MNLPKLNLRDLFWILVVVAMGVCWWLDHRATQLRFAACDSELKRSDDALEGVSEIMAAHGFKIIKGGKTDAFLVRVEEP
jgi:hypothetical protein